MITNIEIERDFDLPAQSEENEEVIKGVMDTLERTKVPKGMKCGVSLSTPISPSDPHLEMEFRYGEAVQRTSIAVDRIGSVGFSLEKLIKTRIMALIDSQVEIK